MFLRNTKFVQWIPDDWPDKAGSLDDLKIAWDEEEQQLRPGVFNFSEYEGFLETQVEAKGYFKVEDINGRWWFVDPESYLFYSLGSNHLFAGGSF